MHHFWKRARQWSWMPHWCRSWILCTRCQKWCCFLVGWSIIESFPWIFSTTCRIHAECFEIAWFVNPLGFHSRIMNLYIDDITYIITIHNLYFPHFLVEIHIFRSRASGRALSKVGSRRNPATCPCLHPPRSCRWRSNRFSRWELSQKPAI